MTPNLAVIRIETGHRWRPAIPLPLFLLWIPGVLLAPFVVLMVWVYCLVFKLRLWRSLGVLWDLLCSLPGTHVRVCAEGKRISIRIV